MHEGTEWHTYSILTTPPNKEMSTLHDRMPAIINKEDYTQWLGADRQSDIQPLLLPYQDNGLEIFEVSREVNTVKANDSKLILPINSK
ncbi:hypothetical protein D3C73_1484510 [compost metagenome]